MAEPLNTLKVIAPGTVLIALAAYIVLQGFGGDLAASQSAPTEINAALVIVGLVLSLLGWMTFAIFWHRHALLQDEARHEVMTVTGRIYWQYFKGALIVLLLAMLAAFALGFGAFFVTAVFSAASPSILSIVTLGTTLTINMAISWILLRNSLVLPAAATGAHLTVSESWAATAPVSRDIFWTAILLSVINVLLQQMMMAVAATQPGLVLPASLVQIILQSLIFISVLSTLYGHLVQHRPLE
ncbi:hypothetical protein [Roseobacter cerasinus]|uniref:hypothetical protein n=1 Tax=Roseobacter cerasinus TaxID=2602289 RepID=UPI001359040A|nr:hypothetical protein [Roseobacter cerasinus]